MDQIKIGVFLKELRRAKGLTQEQLAEVLNVSSRTVSRWETGSNMPDISMLVEIAVFYDVSIPEIIEGERKSENMDIETQETAIAMAKYSQKSVKTEIKIPASTKDMGKRAFFSINSAINKIGTKTDTNKI